MHVVVETWREWVERLLLLALGTTTVLLTLGLLALCWVIYSIGVP